MSLSLTPVGLLTGVEGCSLSGSLYADVRWGGSISWSGDAVPDPSVAPIVHPWYIVTDSDGTEHRYPVCPPCFFRSADVAENDLVPASTTVNLYDVTYALAKRLKLTQTTAFPSGVNIVDTVVSRLAASGMRVSATPSEKTLTAAQNQDPGTSEMKTLNELLSAAGYWAVHSDDMGQIVVAPWDDPASREPAYTFGEGDVSIVHSVTRSLDDFDVPNRITAVARAEQDQTPLTATVTLDSIAPGSPYTYEARGYWVDGDPMLDQDAADIGVLTNSATRELLRRSTVTEKLALTHPWVPEVRLGSVVRYRGARYAVQRMSVTLDLGMPVQAEWARVG